MNKRWLFPLALAIAGCAEKNAPPAGTAAKVAVATQRGTGGADRSAKERPIVAQAADQRSGPEVAAGEFGSAIARAHPERAKAMLAAATKAVEATKATYDMGTSTLADLHHWSRQLVLAERALAQSKEEDLAALVDYWKRSKQTYLKVRALYNTGSRGGEIERFAAATYYLSEAELWIEAAGGTVPEDTD